MHDLSYRVSPAHQGLPSRQDAVVFPVWAIMGCCFAGREQFRFGRSTGGCQLAQQSTKRMVCSNLGGTKNGRDASTFDICSAGSCMIYAPFRFGVGQPSMDVGDCEMMYSIHQPRRVIRPGNLGLSPLYLSLHVADIGGHPVVRACRDLGGKAVKAGGMI